MNNNNLIRREVQEYLSTSEGQERSNTGFEVRESTVINALIVGRSQTGKTTLLESLKNTNYASYVTGFSGTRNVTHHPIIIREKETNRYYQINLIDTIGLHEHSQDPANNRSDEEILTLVAKFIAKEITSLNAVIFVSKAGDLHLHDISAFRSLMTFLGSSFRANTMMVLTHCEGLTKDRFDILANGIRTHPSSRDISDYCSLGIHPHGTLNFDQLETFVGEGDFDLRKRFIEKKLEIITPMRRNILQLLIAQHEKQLPVQELQEILKIANEERMRFVEVEIRKKNKKNGCFIS
ncbi:hypothetical protein I4U23_005407 [Adineta vaga]|nr:hypothetical protein I4U23_005407 [Adineta vaga]